MALSPLTDVLIREKQGEFRHRRYEERTTWPGRQWPEQCGRKPRNSHGHQKLEETKNGFRPGVPPPTPRSTAFLTPRFQALGLQNCETDFCQATTGVAVCYSSRGKQVQGWSCVCCFGRVTPGAEQVLKKCSVEERAKERVRGFVPGSPGSIPTGPGMPEAHSFQPQSPSM